MDNPNRVSPDHDGIDNATFLELAYNADNENSSFSPEMFPLNYRIIATMVHVIIFLAGVVGNVAVVIVVWKTRSLQCPTYSYLVSSYLGQTFVLNRSNMNFFRFRWPWLTC